MGNTSNGMVTVECHASVRETAKRLSELLEASGLTIFAHIDHGRNALEVGMELRPTELLIFGNPTAGTPLMQDRQTAGLDLPFKALIWEDDTGKIWLTYNDPAWLADRHGLSQSTGPIIEAIRRGMLKSASTVCGA